MSWDTEKPSVCLQISTHMGRYSAHLMHMWNWFTGVRAQAHVSISSSTELKFYHLFVFKAKSRQLILLLRGRNLRKHLFHRQGWVTAPPVPPTQLNPVPGQRKSEEEMKCTCQHPPLLLQLLSKTRALWLQRPTILGREDVPRRRILTITFLRITVQQNHVSSTWRKFWKGNALKFTAPSFHTKLQSCDTQERA